MKKILIIFCFLFIVSCGPSQQEKENVAAVTCSIMSETRNMDAAIRVREMNNAREKIGKGPFLRGDEAIKEAFEYGFCKELVLDDSYNEILQPLKDAKRERERIAEENRIAAEKRAAEKRAEEQRIAAEKQRIAAEKQRLADSKPTVEELFHYNGNKKRTSSYQPKSDGGKLYGPYKEFFLNGQIKLEVNYINGNKEGLMVIYYEDGLIKKRINYKKNKRHGLSETYHTINYLITSDLTRKQQLETRTRYFNGSKNGIDEKYFSGGGLVYKHCYILDKKFDISLCYI
tara:strand:- start:198 stop:1058 length:861 start_codon:yes stop_codon:yes gene_type:complete